MAKIAVAMSGGVDSSVAALKIVRGGHAVFGLTMRILPDEDAALDLGDDAAVAAARVAAQLGVPHHTVDLRGEFQRTVIDEFVAEYARGRTPNPCVACNQALKFGHLYRAALDLGAEAVATGHYVQAVELANGRLSLRRATDATKDQTYALYRLSQDQLRRALFPLGALSKGEVRRLAAAAGLPVADKPESQDLCFVPGGDYRAYLRRQWPAGFLPGPILDQVGNVLGQHQGIVNFTVGQRRGIGVAATEPLYVLEIRPEANAVVVGPARLNHSHSLIAADCSWMGIDALRRPLQAEVKIRYGAAAVPAQLAPLADAPGSTKVSFAHPQRAISPGQAAVFYEADTLLGGGTIERALATPAK